MPEKAAAYLKNRIFNPHMRAERVSWLKRIFLLIFSWEGGLSGKRLCRGHCFYKTALEYPENYQEGRGVTAREAAVYFHMAKALEAAGEERESLCLV